MKSFGLFRGHVRYKFKGAKGRTTLVWQQSSAQSISKQSTTNNILLLFLPTVIDVSHSLLLIQPMDLSYPSGGKERARV